MNFYRRLISDDNTTSSRRFIAVWTLPWYWIAIIAGIVVGVLKTDFRFYLAALIASGTPIAFAFFAFTWEHAKGLLNTKLFSKKTDLFSNNDELIDP